MKLCVNCRHHILKDDAFTDSEHYCANPILADAVTGWETLCDENRTGDYLCGREGIYWKAKSGVETT